MHARLRSIVCATPRPGALLLVLCGALAQTPAHAQQPPAEDPVREAAALVVYANNALDRGSWDDALKSLRQAVAADPKNEAAHLAIAWALEHSGDPVAAAAAIAAAPTSPRVLTRQAELARATGDREGALKFIEAALAADEAFLPARRFRALLFEDAGRRESAAEWYEDVNRRWARNGNDEDTDEDLLAVARARSGLYRVSSDFVADANTILARYEPLVTRAKPAGPIEAFVETGDLYLRSTRHVDALKWYKKAAERNPHYAPAIFGLARQLAFGFDDVGATKEAERAVRENPRYVPAILFLAQIALGDGNYEKAETQISAALAVNSQDPEARATRAALSYLRGDRGAYDAEVKAILERSPRASVAYRVLADVLEEQRRFAEACEVAKKAAETDPRDFDSAFLAARNLLNVGQDDEAVKILTAADKDDPFSNTYRTNFLKLFRYVEAFPVRKEGRFVVRVPPAEEAPYMPLIGPALEASLTALEAKWGVTMETPLYIQIFDRQEDFATRTIGLPGLPALGACFGRVITLDSPRALPAGAFGWRGTMHHELAHSITLQLSKGRIPRWLTEGLSVYEERKVSPVWNREMERELIDAIAGGDVLTLENVNNAFRGSRVMFAYYQGGLMCEFIEQEFGFPKLREMVRAYGDGTQTPKVVRDALGVEPAEFDARFLAWARNYVKDIKVLPRPSAEAVARLRTTVRKTPADAEAWFLLSLGQMMRRDTAAALDSLSKYEVLEPKSARGAALRALVAWRQNRPDQAVRFAKDAIDGGYDIVDLRMNLAKGARDAQDFDAAKDHLRRAIELFPQVSGPESPRIQLAELLMGEGDAKLEEAMTLLRAHVAVAEDDHGHRKVLATFYRNRSMPSDELVMLEELRDIVPLPNVTRNAPSWSRDEAIELHERLTRLYLDRKEFASAETAARMAAEVSFMDLGKDGPPPAADELRGRLIATHGETLRLLGRLEEAKRRAQEGARLAPESEEVQDLLQQLGKT